MMMDELCFVEVSTRLTFDESFNAPDALFACYIELPQVRTDEAQAREMQALQHLMCEKDDEYKRREQILQELIDRKDEELLQLQDMLHSSESGAILFMNIHNLFSCGNLDNHRLCGSFQQNQTIHVHHLHQFVKSCLR